MRRTILGLTTGMIAALLYATPALADEAAPRTQAHADGSQTYVDPSLTDEPTTQVEGVLRTVVADSDSGSTESTVIMTEDGTVVPVDFDAAITAADGSVTAELVDGSRLEAAMDGRPTGPVEVASARVEKADASAASADHHAYVVVVTDSGPMDATSAIESRIDAGLAYWKQEAGAAIPSFTRTGATQELDSAYTGAKRCGVSDPYAVWNEAADKFPGVNFSAAGNHLIVVVSEENCAAYGVGIGIVGSSIGSGGQVVMTDDPTIFPLTIAHELGHNFGLDHANFCEPGCAAPLPYWDLYSVMGLAVVKEPAGYLPAALDSVYRAQLGITVPGETASIAVGQTLSTEISPRGSAGGLRGVEVLAGGNSYWIEYRNGAGRDAASFYALGSSAGGRAYPDGVTVTRQATGSHDPAVLLARSSATGAWQAGQTFVLGSVRVAVNSLGPTADVTVTGVPVLSGPKPRITGKAKVGKTLTVSHTGWPAGTTRKYRWLANGKPITSYSTKRTYKIKKSMKGKYITAQVHGSKPGFVSVTKTSARTKKVAK